MPQLLQGVGSRRTGVKAKLLNFWSRFPS